MFAIVSLHGSFECCECTVNLLVNGYVDFGWGCPNNNDAVAVVFSLEATDVFAYGFHHVPTSSAIFYVVTIEALSVVFVESSLHRHNSLEFIANRLDVTIAEHLGVKRAFVSIFGINVPCTKHDVVEWGKGNDFAVVKVFFVFATTHANLIVLSHWANRFGQTFACHEHTSHEGSGNSAQTDAHYT